MKTDRQLHQDVMAELEWDPWVPAAAIGVAVSGGVVTLAREVGGTTEKLNGERALRRVSGVKDLADDSKVNLIGRKPQLPGSCVPGEAGSKPRRLAAAYSTS